MHTAQIDKRLADLEKMVTDAYRRSDEVQNEQMHLIQEIKKSQERERALETVLKAGIQVIAN